MVPGVIFPFPVCSAHYRIPFSTNHGSSSPPFAAIQVLSLPPRRLSAMKAFQQLPEELLVHPPLPWCDHSLDHLDHFFSCLPTLYPVCRSDTIVSGRGWPRPWGALLDGLDSQGHAEMCEVWCPEWALGFAPKVPFDARGESVCPVSCTLLSPSG